MGLADAQRYLWLLALRAKAMAAELAQAMTASGAYLPRV